MLLNPVVFRLTTAGRDASADNGSIALQGEVRLRDVAAALAAEVQVGLA
jgi:hypothetical protein